MMSLPRIHPLQYSCLENPMGRRLWWATVHRVAKSWTQLKQLSMHAPTFQGPRFSLSGPCLLHNKPASLEHSKTVLRSASACCSAVSALPLQESLGCWLCSVVLFVWVPQQRFYIHFHDSAWTPGVHNSSFSPGLLWTQIFFFYSWQSQQATAKAKGVKKKS